MTVPGEQGWGEEGDPNTYSYSTRRKCRRTQLTGRGRDQKKGKGGLPEAAPLSQTLKKQVYEQRNCLAEFELSW